MQTTRKTTVDIDTRRTVFMIAKARSKGDVVKVPHEAFVRNLLKSKLGWPKNEPAPDAIKVVAKAVAAQLNTATLEASKRAIKLTEALQATSEAV